jgi:uncharacterized membrane protein YpjA
MNKYVRIVLFGFLTWLVAFVISILVFPLHAAQRPFFETIMAVVVTATAVCFAILYLRQTRAGFLREGLLIGVAWFAINSVIDLPLFMLEGPMKMPLADYMMDIGLTYLIYPIVTCGFGYLLDRKR